MSKILKILGIVLVLIFLVSLATVGAGWVWLQQQLKPVSANNEETIQFVIPSGQAVITIANRLQTEGMIRHPLAFRYQVWQSGIANKIQAGSFELSPSMTTGEVASALTKGTQDQWVTIPEGLRREEVAEVFAEFPEFDETEFLELTAGKEGYLFPDTYLLPKAATTEFIVSYLTNTFETKTAALQQQVEAAGKSWVKTVVMASIIQREAKTASDMKLVSGILENRLAINQALQVDATLQYIKGRHPISKKWWTPPLAIDKELDSPFNTYKVVGIPPSPICNPGLEALSAAVNPTPSEYYFYLHASDGQMYYSEDYDGHLENIQKYLK